jgi:uncharacterized membrane protein
MSLIEESVEVSVPVRMAYNQWTQFEDFPDWLSDVESVKQIDDITLHWTVSVAGHQRSWDAQITEQLPDRLISWRTAGNEEQPQHTGTVRFEQLDPHTTLIRLEAEFEPSNALERTAEKLGLLTRRARADLQRFKELIEERHRADGAWRGEIQAGDVICDDDGQESWDRGLTPAEYEQEAPAPAGSGLTG